MNVFKARLSFHDPETPIVGMDDTLPKQSLDLETLSPTLINGTFCTRLVPDQSVPFLYDQHTSYTCRLRTMVIPRNMYRIKDITLEGQRNASEIPLVNVPEMDSNGHPIESGEILLLDVCDDRDIPDDPVYRSSFAKVHPCEHQQMDNVNDIPEGAVPVLAQLIKPADFPGISGGGGNPCIKLTLVRGENGSRSYAAVLWDWKNTYGHYDPGEKDEDDYSRLETVFKELSKKFSDISPVPLIASDAPDGGIVWLTVPFENEAISKLLDEVLMKSVIENVDFPVDSPYFFDGPDIAVSLDFSKMITEKLAPLTYNQPSPENRLNPPAA